MRLGRSLGVVAVVAVLSWWLWGRDVGDESNGPGVEGVSERPPAQERQGLPLEAAPSAGAANLRGACTIAGRVTREGAAAEAAITLQRVADANALRAMREDPGQMLEGMFRLENTPLRAPVATARTQGGSFELRDLAPGIYRVSALDAAGFVAEELAALMDEHPRAEVTLALARADEVLEGRVVWSDGTPARGRLVVERDEGGLALPHLGEARGPVELDAEGKFRVEAVRPGVVALRVVTVEGVLAREGRIVVPRKESYLLTIEARTQAVRGRVISVVGETAVPGAAVIALPEGVGDAHFSMTRTTAGADGTFTLLTGALPVKLAATASGFMHQELRVEKAEDLVVRLRPHGRVTGRVVTAADKKPIAGAGVVAEFGPGARTAMTGADGRFEISGIEDRSVRLFVRGGGWVSAELGDRDAWHRHPLGPLEHPLKPGQPLEVELLAVPSAALEGRVLDGAGGAVSGARVEVQGLGDLGTDGWGSVTAVDGSFRVADLPPGVEIQLQARSTGGDTARSGPHLVGGPPVEIRLASGRWEDVTVLYADDGTPVIGAEVMLSARSASGSHGTGGFMTDAQGRARAGPAGQGTLSVGARSDELARGQADTPVEGSDGEASELRVTVRAVRGSEIRGRVLLPDGSAAPRAGVRIEISNDDHHRPLSVRAGSDGVFSLRGLPAGEHELRGQLEIGERLCRGTVRAAAGRTDVVLRLEDAAKDLLTLRVRVLDGQGQPVPRARVQMLVGDQGGDSVEVRSGTALWRTDPASALAKALEDGTLVLEVSQAETTDGQPLPWGSAQAGPLGRGQREIEVRLPPELRIEGRVVDSEGRPVAGVGVSAERQVLRMGSGFGSPEARTDAEGRFRIGRLGPGGRRLSLDVPPGFLTPEPLDSEPGGPALEIRLTRGVSARVRVLDAHGAVVAGAQVLATPAAPTRTRDPEELMRAHHDARHAARSARSGPDGNTQLRGLDPALVWSVTVTPPHERHDLLPWTVTPWSPADTEARLEAALTIEGFVRDASGAPVPETLVYHGIEAHGWQGHLVAPDGSFRIRGLRAGQVVRLSVVGSRGVPLDPHAEPQATMAAGAKGIVLTVDPGATLTLSIDDVGATGGQRQVQILREGRSFGLEPAFSGAPQREGALLHYRGLPRAVLYTVWVPPDDAGRYGLVRDVRADGSVVSVRLQQGKTIQGRLSAPEGAKDLMVSARSNGLTLHGKLDGQGGYEIRGVPPGRWEVNALGVVEGAYASARAEAEGGQTLDLVLVAR